MADFSIPLPTHTSCEKCQGQIALAETACPKCGQYDPYRLNFQDFFAELEAMRITDARLGGLVIGRLTAKDDIPMWHWRDGTFAVAGLMQGGEYIISKAASARHGQRLEQINSEKGVAAPIQVAHSQALSVINTNLMPPGGGLWISWSQYVINRYATAKYFDELERLNASAMAT